MKLAIYGAGQYGENFYKVLSKYEFKIRCHNHLCLETILYCKVKND